MKLFIVGEYCATIIQNNENCIAWNFMGIFSSEEKALQICQGHEKWFIAPALLDEFTGLETTDWNGCYYPSLEIKLDKEQQKELIGGDF